MPEAPAAREKFFYMFLGKYPSRQWAHPYVMRGTDQAAALGIGAAGSTFAQATPEQQAQRRAIGWYGVGDYMQGQGDYSAVPKFTGQQIGGAQINLGKNKQMIRSEVFFNVLSPVASQQQIQQFEINIGLDEMFPVGSQFANNYKKYRITQLAFTYKNMLPQSQTTQQVGQVSLTFNPDVGEENDITTNMQVANDQSTVSCNANEDMTLFCEMDPNRGATNQFLNIRNKELRSTQDPTDFDAGVLVLTLAGFPATAAPVLANYQIGRLSVSYCVELQHEVVNTSMGSSIDMDFFAKASQPLGGAVDFFDTRSMYVGDNSVGCKLTNFQFTGAPQLSIQWPQTAFGYYQIEINTESRPIAAAILLVTPSADPNFTLFSTPKTVGPVYDMVDTSSGALYGGAWTSQCLAPSGAAINTGAAPYCYGNGTQSWFPVAVAGTVAIGSVYRTSHVFHVYVPGISSSAVPPSPAAAASGETVSASPIQLILSQNMSGYVDNVVAPSSNLVFGSKWTVRVTEYNSTMRIKLNGAQDAPYLKSAAGVPTILNATSWP